MGAGLRIDRRIRFGGPFRLRVHIDIRRRADRGELKALGVLEGAAVIYHSGHIDPIAAVIKLRLSAGIIFMERNVKEAGNRIRGAHAANPVIHNGRGVLDIDRIGNELVRQGKDLIRIIGRIGGVIAAGGGQAAGGYPKLIQIDGTGGLYVKLIRCGLGEGAGADEVAVDEVIKLAVGYGDPHGHPLIFVAVVRKIGKDVLRGRPAIFIFCIMTNFKSCAIKVVIMINHLIAQKVCIVFC